MLTISALNSRVTNNFKEVTLRRLVFPLFLLVSISLYFIITSISGNHDKEYINIQKDVFFKLNRELSKFPFLEFNLTQLGDALICFPLLAFFFIYAPKLWKVVLTSSILSLLVSAGLKRIFAVPRPAAVFDPDSFVIIGKKLSGSTSLPSGHSITIFILITTLLFAFMPATRLLKIVWQVSIISLGLLVASSRVGVGAHYPLDVVIGCTIGYILAVLGIVFNNKVNWLSWFDNKKYYPVFCLLFAIWCFLIFKRVAVDNLPVYYLSIISLVVPVILMINIYVKKKD